MSGMPGAGAGAMRNQGFAVVKAANGFGVVPATKPNGDSIGGGVVGAGVVGGGGVVGPGCKVGAGVIFQSGGGPSVGRRASVSPGRPGRPGKGLAKAPGNGGGGPGRGTGGGGGAIGGCAGAGIVVVAAGNMAAQFIAPLPLHPLPVVLP